jgi:hypothetical protein
LIYRKSESPDEQGHDNYAALLKRKDYKDKKNYHLIVYAKRDPAAGVPRTASCHGYLKRQVAPNGLHVAVRPRVAIGPIICKDLPQAAREN